MRLLLGSLGLILVMVLVVEEPVQAYPPPANHHGGQGAIDIAINILLACCNPMGMQNPQQNFGNMPGAGFKGQPGGGPQGIGNLPGAFQGLQGMQALQGMKGKGGPQQAAGKGKGGPPWMQNGFGPQAGKGKGGPPAGKGGPPGGGAGGPMGKGKGGPGGGQQVGPPGGKGQGRIGKP